MELRDHSNKNPILENEIPGTEGSTLAALEDKNPAHDEDVIKK